LIVLDIVLREFVEFVTEKKERRRSCLQLLKPEGKADSQKYHLAHEGTF